MEVVEHPSYYSLRSEMIYFLNQQKRIKKLRARKTGAIARHGLEKVNLDIGFLPLVACAPIAIAKEKGFFKKHGLDEVNLVRETSWRGIVDGMVGGYVDAAQMPSGMPLWLSLGGNNDRILPVVTSLTMTRNGNAITLDKRFYDLGVRTLPELREYLLKTRDQRHTFGVVHPASMHNLLLRYWLAAGGIDPDVDVHLQNIPPAQMVADLRNDSIDGYCVGEPWNFRAAVEGAGFTVATDVEVWNGHPGKVLGVREDWANAYPNTHIALVKALLEACKYCSDKNNIDEIRWILSQRPYIGTSMNYIHLGDPSVISCDLDMPMREYAHHLFHGEGVNRPSRTEHLWHMVQMARWGHTPFPRNWLEILERVCRVNTFSTAAREIGVLNTKFNRGSIKLFDGSEFNADDPIAYLNELKIKRDITIAEVVLDAPSTVAA
jgi:bicarbonate transport system ATP-binding protein